VADYDDMIGRSLHRIEGMNKLIHDLLDLTRIESGKNTRKLAAINLRDAAQAAADTMQAEATSRNIAIRIHAADDLTMTADAGEIEMLLNNLISNAVKYNRDGGSVDVTIACDASRATLAVADTGIGMASDEVGRIFDEFTRIKNEQTNHIPGSGLGLSIVKKLVQMYDGEVKVESRPQAGTTFTLVLNTASAIATGAT
jgi:signal transduction histidine kinase